jgi:diguanylate cyclase (GGDEF)-like protein
MQTQNIKQGAAMASVQWQAARAEARRDDAGDRAAGLGRWWLARGGTDIALSPQAARFLGIPSDTHAFCMDHVEPGDRAALRMALGRIGAGSFAAGACCEFRVRHDGRGLRWLRLQPVAPFGEAVAAGILLDVTEARNAAARERFNFALTQYLVGADSLDEGVVKVLQLVCEELGWEWGAFWALDEADGGDGLLRCRYSWQAPRRALEPFRQASASLAMAPGQGLTGEVWADGAARWLDDVDNNPSLVRADAARACGLQSAYFFPVTFVTAEGRLVRPGVLEFFSELQRQPDAKLPGLAESISAMIAQAVERMAQQQRIRLRAQTDEMTGLANRGHFHELLDQQCRQQPPAAGFGVLYVDLDHFKPINDVFGHEAGNVVLAEFARRLRALAPSGWRIGRLGGDEFALLSAPGSGRTELDAVATTVCAAACAPFPYLGHELGVSASVGIGMYPDHGNCTRELLHAADAAMYLSKRKGRNLASFFDARPRTGVESAA